MFATFVVYILTKHGKCKFILTVKSGKLHWGESKRTFLASYLYGLWRGAVAYFIPQVFQNLTVKISFQHHAFLFL